MMTCPQCREEGREVPVEIETVHRGLDAWIKARCTDCAFENTYGPI